MQGVVKSYDWRRRSLIVTPDTIKSISPLLRLAKMPVNGVLTMRRVNPRLSAIARMISTSKPTISLAGVSYANGG